MGHLLPAYKRNERGRVVHMICDSDAIPDGWVDSPDKVPGNEPARVEVPMTISPEPKPAPAMGEPAVVRRPPGRPRKHF